MKKLLLIFLFALSSVNLFACHAVTVTETSAVDNGNGTYTYTFDVCTGIEQTYGFYLDFTGLGTIVSYSASVTGPTTTNVLTASVPPISGVGDLEYGDWDNLASPPFSNGSECTTVTVTFDDVIDGVTMGVTQQNAGGCTGTADATNCFASTSPMYTMVIDMPNCSGWARIILDGVYITLNIPADGTIQTFTYCGACGTAMRIYAPKFTGGGCGGGIDGYSIYDQAGALIQSGGSNYPLPNGNPSPFIDIDVSCTVLPIELEIFHGYNKGSVNHIEWVTATEINNDYFTLERSRDAINWDEIGTLEGSGNSNTPVMYEFSDDSYDNGTNYYKLTQTDFDGAFESFEIISITTPNVKFLGYKIINLLGQDMTDDINQHRIIIWSDNTSKFIPSGYRTPKHTN